MVGRGRPIRVWAAAALCCAWGLAQNPREDGFRFCILGDRTGDAQPGVYERVWREVDAYHPDFVINAGDTIQGGSDESAQAEWNALRPIWTRYQYPLYFTPGNHDIWSAESRRIYGHETGHPAFYSFDYQNAHFTVLDNSETEDLSDAQMNFLARDLEAHSTRDPKFVFFHKPFWVIPVKFGSSDFPFHRLVKKYGVRFVISGHTHRYDSALDDGIAYIQVCSSGGRLKGQGFEDGWFFGNIEVRVMGARVEMNVKEIGPRFGIGRRFAVRVGDNKTR